MSSLIPPLRGAVARPAAPASHRCSSSRRPAAFTSGRLSLAFRCTLLPSPAISVEKVRRCRGRSCPEIQAAVSATGTGPPRRRFSAQVAANDAGSAASGARRRALPSVRHLRAAHRGLALAEEAGPCCSAHLPQGHPPFYRELLRSYRWTTEGCPPTPAVQRLAPEARGCFQGPRSHNSVRVLLFALASPPSRGLLRLYLRSPMPTHLLCAASAR